MYVLSLGLSFENESNPKLRSTRPIYRHSVIDSNNKKNIFLNVFWKTLCRNFSIIFRKTDIELSY